MLKPRINLIQLSRNLSKLSYFHKVGEFPLLSATAGQLLSQTAKQFGDRDAIISCHQNKTITYKQLQEEVDKFAVGLRKLELQYGDSVAIWAPNSIEWIVSSLACARLGCPLVQLNHSYRKNELVYSLNKTNSKALICGHTNKRQNYYNIIKEVDSNIFDNGNVLKSKHIPSLRSVIMMDNNPTGTYRFEELQMDHSDEEIQNIETIGKQISFDDSLNIQFTSGSTGNPKAAVLTHHNMVNNSYSVGYRMKFNEKQHTICVQVPLFHTFGTTAGIYSALNFGPTLVLPTDFYNPAKALRSIKDHNCTVIYGTPTMHIDLIEEQKQQKLDIHADIACSGGAPTTPKLIEDIYKYFGCHSVVNFYGLTESTAIIFESYLHSAVDHAGNTVGNVTDHAEVKVVDENNKLVPFGTTGELCVRGYLTMLEYLDDPEKTKNTIDELGWLKTGDKFVLFEDGSGKIVGRIKDIIIRGGENIHPKEIEDHITKHPKIIDCQVIGLPHERLGEEICVCVRLQLGESLHLEDVIQFCKEELAHYKIPSKLHILDEYPKTTSGKIQKFKIIEQLKAHYNL